MHNFLKKKSLAHEYAKFVAVDGWSFYSVARSDRLRMSLISRKFVLEHWDVNMDGTPIVTICYMRVSTESTFMLWLTSALAC